MTSPPLPAWPRRSPVGPLPALLVLSAVALAVRIYASREVGFGDSEALYAAYALHPQPAYLDHPGLVGVLARAIGSGTAPDPHTAHAFTALLATLAPWALVLAARGAGAAWRDALVVGIAVAFVPEIAVGLFAMTPDLILFFAWTLALGSACAGLRAKPSSTRAAACFVGAGLAAGIGSAAKVSALLLAVALAAAYASRPARAHAKTAWPWVGLVIGGLVALPVLTYESRTGWPMLQHRFADTQAGAGVSLRNFGALLAGQLVYLSPLIVVLAVLVARDLWRTERREGDAVSRLLFLATAIPLVGLSFLGLWSRVAEPHWVAPALLALPFHFARARGTRSFLPARLGVASVATAALFSIAAHVWVLTPSLVSKTPASYDARLDLATELYGWPEVVLAVRTIASEERIPGDDPGAVVVVGPHWIVCAQLEAALKGDVAVGCATPLRDDFDDWYPRARWMQAEKIIFVTDNRFDVDAEALFPDRMRLRGRKLTLTRGGKVGRVFRVEVLDRRAPA